MGGCRIVALAHRFTRHGNANNNANDNANNNTRINEETHP